MAETAGQPDPGRGFSIATDELEAHLATAALAAGDSTGWFDQLYAAGEEGRVAIPWSRIEAHPLLAAWASGHDIHGCGRRALVVGCGLGADAEYLSSLGFATTAFDISPAAIRLARRRHPSSGVEYTTANLFEPPAQWWRAYDLVVEVITVQALPIPTRLDAIVNVGRLVAPGGTLLAIEDVGATHTARKLPPWPLGRDEIESFAADGLDIVKVDVLPIHADPNARRWVAHFRRPSIDCSDTSSRGDQTAVTPNPTGDQHDIVSSGGVSLLVRCVANVGT